MQEHQPQSTDNAVRAFRTIAFVEAITWTGLLIGMVLKHVTETTDMAVTVFGWLHGIAFPAYLLVTLFAASALRWSRNVTLIALAAGIPPLLTIVAERWLTARGHLRTRRDEPVPG